MQQGDLILRGPAWKSLEESSGFDLSSQTNAGCSARQLLNAMIGEKNRAPETGCCITS